MTDVSKRARVEKITDGIKKDLTQLENLVLNIKKELNYLNNIIQGGYNQ